MIREWTEEWISWRYYTQKGLDFLGVIGYYLARCDGPINAFYCMQMLIRKACF